MLYFLRICSKFVVFGEHFRKKYQNKLKAKVIIMYLGLNAQPEIQIMNWLYSCYPVFPGFKLHPSRFVSHLIHFWFCSIHLLVWGMQEFLSIIKPLWRLLSTFIPKRNMSLSWKKILTSRQVRITLYEFPKVIYD